MKDADRDVNIIAKYFPLWFIRAMKAAIIDAGIFFSAMLITFKLYHEKPKENNLFYKFHIED